MPHSNEDLITQPLSQSSSEIGLTSTIVSWGGVLGQEMQAGAKHKLFGKYRQETGETEWLMLRAVDV